mmetsp:Transcript_18575/g.51306  ORF Transcript_18575/g.51306 Transcript_18575/m.51306 type:complete len:128 (-) Transcript_18575:209-592(-)
MRATVNERVLADLQAVQCYGEANIHVFFFWGGEAQHCRKLVKKGSKEESSQSAASDYIGPWAPSRSLPTAAKWTSAAGKGKRKHFKFFQFLYMFPRVGEAGGVLVPVCSEGGMEVGAGRISTIYLES